MRHASLAIAALLVAAILAGCKPNKPEAPPMPLQRVTVIQPVSAPVPDYWYYNGYLETTEFVEVRSKIRSFLTAVKFTEGTEVQGGTFDPDPAKDIKGTLLYELDQREFKTANEKAKAELEKAKSELEKADADEKSARAQIDIKVAQLKQATADRAQKEAAQKSGSASQAEVDLAIATADVRKAEIEAAKANAKAAVANLDASKANVEAAKSALHSTEIILGYTRIHAKINGRISRTREVAGALIQADTTLLTTIVRVDELYVYFDVPETDLIPAKKMSHNPFNNGGIVELGVSKDEGFPHVGNIDFLDNRVETATGTIRVRGRLKNPMMNGTRVLDPGMYARVRVLKGQPTPQLVLPEDCLLSAQEGRFLYVVDKDNKVEKRIVTVGAVVWKAPPVVPGVTPPNWVAINPNPQKPAEGQPPAPTRRPIKSVVAITAGLQSGDRVILDGIQKVRPGGAVDPEMWNLTPPSVTK